MSRPYRARFVLIACLSALAAAAQLVEPLVYRAAVNDVAGVFVGRASGGPNGADELVKPSFSAASRNGR